MRLPLSSSWYGNLREVLEVGAGTDVHVESCNPHPVCLRELDAVLDLLVPHAMLAERATGIHLARMPVTKARIHAERQFALHAEIGELLDHVGRTHVHRDVVLLHEFKRVAVKDICGVDDFGSLALLLATLETRLQRANDFAGRNRIHHATELAHERYDGEVRACLLGKAHGVKNLDFLHALLDGGAVIEPEGGAVLFGSLHENFLGDRIICHTGQI